MKMSRIINRVGGKSTVGFDLLEIKKQEAC